MEIDIDDKLLDQILKATKAKTYREAVEQALVSYLRHYSKLELLNLRGKVKWEGNLDEMRDSS